MADHTQNVLQCFRDYIGIKVHFNQPLIWNRSMGSKIGMEALFRRKDYKYFDRMAWKYPRREDWIQIFISSFLRDQNNWIGEILERENIEFHKDRMRRIASLHAWVAADIDNLVLFMEENGIDVRKLLLTANHAPYIIENRSSIIGGVTDETLALLNRGFKYCGQATKDPAWAQQAFKLSKYECLLEVNPQFLGAQYQRLAAVKARVPDDRK